MNKPEKTMHSDECTLVIAVDAPLNTVESVQLARKWRFANARRRRQATLISNAVLLLSLKDVRVLDRTTRTRTLGRNTRVDDGCRC